MINNHNWPPPVSQFRRKAITLLVNCRTSKNIILMNTGKLAPGKGKDKRYSETPAPTDSGGDAAGGGLRCGPLFLTRADGRGRPVLPPPSLQGPTAHSRLYQDWSCAIAKDLEFMA